jgi:DNA-binding MarR family transcriptional regulator
MVTCDENTPLAPWICFISRLSMRHMGMQIGRLGFGAGHLFLLNELYEEEGLSQDELSRRVGVDKSNTSRALARLEKSGLIERRGDPEDHKVKKVFLKPEAHRIRNQFKAIQKLWNGELMRGFSREEQKVLFESLRKIADNAEAALNRQQTAIHRRRAA